MSSQTTSLDRQVDGRPIPLPGTYAIDPQHSTVQAVAKHLMVTKVRGRFTEFDGTITVGENPVDSRVDVTIQGASIDTRTTDRDEHLRSPDFLDVQRFPQLTFRTTSIDPGGDTWKVTGDLTIRDVTQSVTLETEYLGTFKNPWGETVAAFSAETSLNREEFGMTWNAPLETGGVLVGKDLKIELEVQAKLQEG